MRSARYRILRSYKDTPHGPSDRIRTCGILLPKQARYQLRYTRLLSFLSGWAYSPKCGAVPAPLYPVDSAVGDSPSIPHSGRDFKTFYRVPDHGPGMKVSTKEKAPSSQMVLFGAGDEARTRYLDLGKVALYQMSYARKRKIDYTPGSRICQPLRSAFFSFFSAKSR